MNPDPNQPEQPQEPAQTPTPETPQTPIAPAAETPTPYASAPVVEPTVSQDTTQNVFGASAPVEPATPNPFGAAPVTSETPVPSPFGGQPAATLGSTPNSDPSSAPTKKSKKKLIVLISVIVGALIVLGGAALAVYLIFFSVTKADYQKAYDQVSAVRDKYSADDSISSGASKEAVDEAKTAYADFKTESAKLADLRALKVDKDLSAKYKTYQDKEKAYIAFGDVFIPSLDRFITAADQIDALGTGSASFTSANIQKTIDILQGVDDITDPTLKAYVDSAIAAYKEILPQAKVYESSSSTNSQKLTAIDAISDSADKLSDAASKMSDDLKSQTKAVSLDDALNDLGQAVTDKLNKAK